MKEKLLNPIPINKSGIKKLLLTMKLTLIIVFLSVLQVSANAYSQINVNLNVQHKSIREVLKTIEQQSQVRFFYSDDLLVMNELIDVKADNKNIIGVLDDIFSKSLLTYKAYDNNLIVIAPRELLQQQQVVTGKVTESQTGEALPGVNVVIKGITIGTITDASGNYSLSVTDRNVTLVFSFIGYTSQEIPLSGRSTLDVALASEITGLEEVVVVGYGTQKKVNLTGAVSAIKIDEQLSNRALPNVSSRMSGLVPGLAVIQNSGMAGKNDITLLIRGLGTVNNANPLIVVDGMPDVNINRLNMNDVESISVLKDATSSAIYGSRAANGVILITTKTGKGQTKPKIEITSSYAAEYPTKAYEFMSDYPRSLTVHQRLASVSTLKTNWFYKDGTIDQWMALGKIDPLRYPNTDVWSWLMRTGSVLNNNVSVSGGSEKSNFFVSLGMMDEKGLQIKNDYSLYNARFSYDYSLTHKMNLGVKFGGNWSNYTYFNSDGFTGDSGGGDLQHAISGITQYDPVTGYFGGVMAYGEDPQAYNLYAFIINASNYQNRQEANPSIYWDWSPIKGLTGRIDYSINYYNQFTWEADMPCRAYNFQTQSFGSRVYVGANAGVSNTTLTGYKTQLSGGLNYQVTLADNHNISALVLYSEEYWYARSQSSSRNDRLYPTLHEIDAALTDIQSTGGYSSAEGLRSYIGRLNYIAYDKYLVEFNFRYDGSSKFLSGHQFGFFPSASIGWRFTEENFIGPYIKNWLNSGKLRISYGSLGNNSGVDRYEQKETLTTNNYMISGSTVKGFVNSKMINQNLSWETTTVMNLGLDLRFLRNRLTAEIDYYNRLTTGMNRPSDMSIHLTGAYKEPRTNIGNLRNRGIEGTFTWRDQSGSFDYTINLNASYNQTILEKWNEFLGRGNTFLNMPYHFLYIYEDIGIAQTWQDVYNATPQDAQPGDILRMDINGDGRIDGNDLKAYPNIQRDRPSANFAMNASLAWKGLDLTVLFQGSAGRKDIWLTDYNNINLKGSGSQVYRYASTWEHWTYPWSVENRDGLWPRLGARNSRNNQTFWLDDLSYLRLKNIQLGYSLPNNWIKWLRIDNLRIFSSLENIATLTKFRGLDPEKTGDMSLAYPLNRSYSIGINISL
jgi:TonB-linked SusC/RagA family outer membrane protein